jgi:hypothetical protein
MMLKETKVPSHRLSPADLKAAQKKVHSIGPPEDT